MMKKLNFLLAAIVSVVCSVQAFAQEVTGTVRDEAGMPIIGATVMVEGTTAGTTTDIDGRFALRAPAEGTALTASFLGYDSQSIIVGGGRLSMISSSANSR